MPQILGKNDWEFIGRSTYFQHRVGSESIINLCSNSDMARRRTTYIRLFSELGDDNRIPVPKCPPKSGTRTLSTSLNCSPHPVPTLLRSTANCGWKGSHPRTTDNLRFLASKSTSAHEKCGSHATSPSFAFAAGQKQCERLTEFAKIDFKSTCLASLSGDLVFSLSSQCHML